MAFLLGKLPPGPILNLGAGEGVSFDDMFVINVDHVAPRLGASRRFVVADAGRLPFRAGAFTGVLLKDVIEHVVDPISVLSEVRTVAGPTGEVVVTVPRAIARAVWDDPTHVRGFTARALMQALELGGWRAARAPGRFGGVPGAGRLGLVPHLELLLRVPGFGHWFGTNWLVQARRA
jgi:SAM-dependent methyltransferase